MQKNPAQQRPDRTRTLRIIARILSIPIVLFSLFTLVAHIIFPDTEPGTYPPIENLLPVLMGLSVLGLALAWRMEGLGAMVTIVFFIAHLGAYWAIRGQLFPLNVMMLFTPVLVDGVLFLVCWRGGNHQA